MAIRRLPRPRFAVTDLAALARGAAEWSSCRADSRGQRADISQNGKLVASPDLRRLTGGPRARDQLQTLRSLALKYCLAQVRCATDRGRTLS